MQQFDSNTGISHSNATHRNVNIVNKYSLHEDDKCTLSNQKL
jgi:hypothetical protein